MRNQAIPAANAIAPHTRRLSKTSSQKPALPYLWWKSPITDSFLENVVQQSLGEYGFAVI
jgi:hypothetical protein